MVAGCLLHLKSLLYCADVGALLLHQNELRQYILNCYNRLHHRLGLWSLSLIISLQVLQELVLVLHQFDAGHQHYCLFPPDAAIA